MSDEWTSIGRDFWKEAGVESKIDLRIAPASETLDRLLSKEGGAEQFDFVFIDGDKTSYDTYYEKCLQLVRPGGLICFDNVLWGGAVVDESDQSQDTVALRSLNEKLQKDERVDISLLPIGDGLTLVLKRW